MHSSTAQAEIARRNGALSKGPKTAAGKARSCRNSLVHGRRAEKLAEFVPPESATLRNEDRQHYFSLLDQNLAKFNPTDPAEKAVVRELTNLQWANLRINSARQAILNRELALRLPHVAAGDAAALAYESAFANKSMTALRYEHSANARLIAQTERRLSHLQRTWPSAHPTPMDSTLDRANHERTTPPPTQPVENTEKDALSPFRVIRCEGPLTAEVIRMYRRLYPHQNLSFLDGNENPAM